MADESDQGAKKPDAPKKDDVLLMHSRTEDGKGIRVLRAREGKVEAGEVRALESGVPIRGEVVSLTQRKDNPALWDVDVHCRVTPSRAHAGPARVSTRAYRDNWDAIFKAPEDEATDEEKLLN